MIRGMTCRELIDFLMDYFDGSLASGERGEFERHLTACPPCVRYLRTYAETVSAGRKAFECENDDLPAVVPEELIEVILESRRRPDPNSEFD